MSVPLRCSFFIDGFNFYHSIDNSPLQNRYKWFNYAALARSYLPHSHQLGIIHYFTAYADWMPDKKRRHKALIRALLSEGVKVRRGKFKEKSRYCRWCQKTWKAHEEKQTDINIAIELMSSAFKNEYDTAIIISGDTDLVPAVRRVKNLFPEKRIGVLFPPGMRHGELERCCDYAIKLYANQLKKFRFSDVVQWNVGSQRLSVACPEEYK
ncbi:hypothetical protein DA2_3031 [Desulfovibrio sp. A2]|nr:hypothetical protein DA2_3031 [Desulfovibrio sp. A2]